MAFTRNNNGLKEVLYMETENVMSSGSQLKRFSLNREAIKYIAIITMFCNHFANMFLQSGTYIFEIMIDIGYFTAITMCYFLAEGYRFTSSKKKYAYRLLIFAVISQIPYLLAIRYLQFNMLFTLLFCFCFIWLNDMECDGNKRYIRRAVQVLLAVLCMYSDWSVFALFFVYVFSKSYGDKNRLKQAYKISIFVWLIYNFVLYINMYSIVQSLIFSLMTTIGPALSSVVILYLYDGKKSKKAGAFSKWFFYLFYPLHLIFLIILKYNICS